LSPEDAGKQEDACFFFVLSLIGLIGRPGTYPGACSGKFTTSENVVIRFSDRGMCPASIINFLSNEDTQELAPGYLHFPSSKDLDSKIEKIITDMYLTQV
jgi:hypothetical protein